MVTGTVTFVATYHYFRIFNSWNDAFDVKFDAAQGGYTVRLTGVPFNDTYHYFRIFNSWNDAFDVKFDAAQ